MEFMKILVLQLGWPKMFKNRLEQLSSTVFMRSAISFNQSLASYFHLVARRMKRRNTNQPVLLTLRFFTDSQQPAL